MQWLNLVLLFVIDVQRRALIHIVRFNGPYPISKNTHELKNI